MFIHSSVDQDISSVCSLSFVLHPSILWIMSSLSFLSVYLTGASLILVQFVGSEFQYDDFTPAPDYDYDYNATFEYSFYSNTSREDLDKFSERFIDQEEGEEDKDVTVTVATTQGTTGQGSVSVPSAASLPVSLKIRTLLWTLLVLISQQLRHTL